MLPAESLADAVAFLPLYDLDSVLFVNRQLSAVAYKCVKTIRVWQFGYVHMFLYENSMVLNKMVMDKGDDDDGRDTRIAVKGRESMTEIIAPDAIIPLPNKSALIVKKLVLCMKRGASAELLVDIMARFRKVQVVNLYECENITHLSPVVDLCRQKGIRRVTHDGEDLMEWR